MSQKLSRSLLVLLLLAGVVAVIAAPTRLTLKFNKGDAFEQSTVIHAKGTSGPEGTQMPQNMDMSMRFDFEVTDVQSDGSVAMKSVLKEMKVGQMDVGKMFGLKDKAITLMLNSKGRISSVEGLENLGPAGGMPDNPLSSVNQVLFPALPDHPVEVGATWRDEGDMEYPGSSAKGKKVDEYVFRDIKTLGDSPIAVIEIKGHTTIKNATMSIPSPVASNVKINYRINSITSEKEGEFLLDIGKGRFLGAKIRIKTDQDLSFATGVQGKKFNSTVKTHMNLDMETNCTYGDEKAPDLSGLYTTPQTQKEETGQGGS